MTALLSREVAPFVANLCIVHVQVVWDDPEFLAPAISAHEQRTAACD
jgi:hypothetical protein